MSSKQILDDIFKKNHPDKNIKITVLGGGHVGQPLALILSNYGYNVVIYDLNPNVVHAINEGRSSLEEFGMDFLAKKGFERGLLSAQSSLATSDIYIIAVPTPIKPDFSANIDSVLNTLEKIAQVYRENQTIIVESTIPPNCSESTLIPFFLSIRPEIKVKFVHSPERIIPGQTLEELIYNSRTIGGNTKESIKDAFDVYSTFVKGQITTSTLIEAELCKLFENAYRDVNIAIANQIALYCNNKGISADRIISLANNHPRVNILKPGIGVGGHCIPIDPWFIIQDDPVNTTIFKSARTINSNIENIVFNKLEKMINKMGDSKVLLLGKTYKPDVADIRESPSLNIGKRLVKLSENIVHFDPYVDNDDLSELVKENWDLIVILVSHSQFIQLFNQQHINPELIFDATKWYE